MEKELFIAEFTKKMIVINFYFYSFLKNKEMDKTFFTSLFSFIFSSGVAVPTELPQSPQLSKEEYLRQFIIFLSQTNADEYNEIIAYIREWIQNNPILLFSLGKMLLIVSKDNDDLVDEIADLTVNLENEILLEYIVAIPIEYQLDVSELVAVFNLNYLFYSQSSIQLTTLYKTLTCLEDEELTNVATNNFDHWCNVLTTMFSKEWTYNLSIMSSIDWTMFGKLIGCFTPAKENIKCGDANTAAWQTLVRHLTNFLHFHKLIIIYDNIEHPWSKQLFAKTMLSSLLIQDWSKEMVQTIHLDRTRRLLITKVGMGQFLKDLKRWDKVPLFQHLVRLCMPTSRQLMKREYGQKMKMGKREKEFVDMCAAHVKSSLKRPRE